MYDMPVDTPEQSKEYRFFRKKLLSFGAYQLQESVYCIHLGNKAKAEKIKKELILCAPKTAHIRSLLLTQQLFETMDMIAGDATFTEQILSVKTSIIEI